MTVRICFVLDASIKLRIFWFHISQWSFNHYHRLFILSQIFVRIASWRKKRSLDLNLIVHFWSSSFPYCSLTPLLVQISMNDLTMVLLNRLFCLHLYLYIYDPRVRDFDTQRSLNFETPFPTTKIVLTLFHCSLVYSFWKIEDFKFFEKKTDCLL